MTDTPAIDARREALARELLGIWSGYGEPFEAGREAERKKWRTLAAWVDAALDACAEEARLEGEGTACYHNDEEEWKLQARNFLQDHGIECEGGACEDILGQWAIAVERRIAARAEARKGGVE